MNFIFFEGIIGKSIVELAVDQQLIDFENLSMYKGECICITLDNHQCLHVSTEDMPHFFGEGDLVFKLEESNSKVMGDTRNKIISKIRLWQWKAKGLLGRKYLSQIEFYCNNQIVLSIGFFSKLANKIDFISTGELYIGAKELTPATIDQRLSYKDIC
jgi:hypothetical protein